MKLTDIIKSGCEPFIDMKLLNFGREGILTFLDADGMVYAVSDLIGVEMTDGKPVPAIRLRACNMQRLADGTLSYHTEKNTLQDNYDTLYADYTTEKHRRINYAEQIALLIGEGRTVLDANRTQYQRIKFLETLIESIRAVACGEV